MKKLILVLAIITYFISCKNEKEHIVSESSIYMPEPLLNDTIIKILDDYLDYTQSTPGIVYQIFVDQDRDSTTIYLTYTQFYEKLRIISPSGYLINKDRLFVMYSGANLLMKADSVFSKNINKEILKYDLKTKGQMMSLIEYPPWAVVFYTGKSKYKIYKRKFCPYNNLWEFIGDF